MSSLCRDFTSSGAWTPFRSAITLSMAVARPVKVDFAASAGSAPAAGAELALETLSANSVCALVQSRHVIVVRLRVASASGCHHQQEGRHADGDHPCQ